MGSGLVVFRQRDNFIKILKQKNKLSFLFWKNILVMWKIDILRVSLEVTWCIRITLATSFANCFVSSEEILSRVNTDAIIIIISLLGSKSVDRSLQHSHWYSLQSDGKTLLKVSFPIGGSQYILYGSSFWIKASKLVDLLFCSRNKFYFYGK